jgi:adenosine deaminase/adenosine deaminase CECR1
MRDNNERKPPIEAKDLYKVLLDTRNLEINLFWQRSNYFLVLNTGIAFGFFNLKDGNFALIFAILGLLASLLWFWVCLGGKFWQTRWEQRLLDFEREHFPHIEFFGAGPERIRADVERGLAFSKRWWPQRIVYRLALDTKPSVSFSMILLSAIFVFGWATFLTVAIAFGIGVPNAGATIAGKQDLNPNYLATNEYYTKLISGDTPSIAELNLFSNMLPKGGDLHHHYSGAIYVETYLDWVDKKNYCICSASECKSKSKSDSKKVQQFGIMTQPPAGACISAQTVRNADNKTFYRELLTRWSDKDYENHFHEQPAPDQQFFDTFGFFGPVSSYSYHDGLQALKERAIAENVEYLETMLTSAPATNNQELAANINALNARSDDAQINTALDAYFDFLARSHDAEQRIDDYVETLEAAVTGIDDANFKLRFQSYVSRNNAPAEVFSGLYSAFSAAKKSKLVVGVNIVGPENGYVAMRDYTLHMKMVRFLKQHFPEIKLSLHAGELALGMVPPEGLKSHINEAVQIAGANRIGHGVDIAHETNATELLGKLKTNDIAIEVNLTSNAFILGVRDEAHPLLLYRQHKVPFVISTDDPGVSRNNLSSEYLLFISRYRPSYDELKQVVYNSIRYAFLSNDEKKGEIMQLDNRFAAFEEKIAGIAPAASGR